MQLSFNSDEPLEHVLDVVSAMYGVRVVADREVQVELPDDQTQGVSKPRH